MRQTMFGADNGDILIRFITFEAMQNDPQEIEVGDLVTNGTTAGVVIAIEGWEATVAYSKGLESWEYKYETCLLKKVSSWSE